MEMCNTYLYGQKLVDAVKDGKVPEERINESVVRIIRTQLAFTEADHKEYPRELLGCPKHISLALEAAEKGITLIQNNNHVLPIDREKVENIVILGKLANKGNLGDKGSSQVFPNYVISPLQGIASAAGNKKVVFNDGSDLDHAKALAQNADYVIFVVGYDSSDEGEYISKDAVDNFMQFDGGDRNKSLGLHKEEIELIREVGPVNRNSCAVLIGGSMIMIEEWKDCVNAIMMAYYPGMEGGTAIGEILFGDVNPSGKLPFVIPKKETDLPKVRWNTAYQRFGYYHGYTKLDKEGKEPSVPYGFGLSYTTFELSDVQFTVEKNVITAACTVKNTGEYAGDEVIQFYAGFKQSAIDRPVKVLKGFQRVSLKPGEAKSVQIKTPIEKLKWFNEKTNSWELEHMEYEMYIGVSSLERDLTKQSIIL
jgi:beta-glucosidase